MITTRDVMPMLLEACPGFGDRWQDHLESWGDDERGSYLDVAQFAHYIVALYSVGQREQLDGAFAVVERLLTEGDSEVKSLASIGIIEDVQNIASHQSFGFRVFEPWLGPASLEEWRNLETVWAGKSSLSAVVREELGLPVKKRPRWWQFWKRDKAFEVPAEAIEDPE